MATNRDYNTACASYIAPKSGGRTKRVLRMFAATRLARRTFNSQRCRSTPDCSMHLQARCSGSAQRLRPKLHGQGPRAEADAARRLRERADVSMQRAAKRRAINVAGGGPPANLV